MAFLTCLSSLYYKDGKPLNVNYADDGLSQMAIPDDMLTHVYLGRCSHNYSNHCSLLGGQISDFNVWDRALSEEEAKDWTSCR